MRSIIPDAIPAANCLFLSFAVMVKRQLVVIGGGAAGFFCAVNAALNSPDLNVILLEKSDKLLSKVRVSGGGRCNVTHACFDSIALAKHYPRGEQWLKKAFGQFNPTHTIEWFAARGVTLKKEADGRMFPVTDDSGTIIQCLLQEANRLRVDMRLKRDVTQLEHTGNGWIVHTSKETIATDFVCVACGGFPKPAQFNWIKALGHTIEEPVPSLFTFNLPQHPIRKLMGVVSDPVHVKIRGTKLQETGPVLITHWGLSGPCILRLSAWGAKILAEQNWQFTAVVNWVPAQHEQSMLDYLRQYRNERGSQKLIAKNPFSLPQRLWEFLLEEAGIDVQVRWSDLPAKDQNKLAKLLVAMELEVKGKTTFKEEFVTAGGVRLHEVDPLRMVSRLKPALYFAGEILDVDGITGGFNFQHAWTSGWLAARDIKNQLGS